MVMNHAHRSLMEGDDGRWRGTGRSVRDMDQKHSFHALTGEGAYEGLSVVLHGVAEGTVRHAPYASVYEGFIFEAELPQLPDEPVPSTNEAIQFWPLPNECPHRAASAACGLLAARESP
jgi:hypothetical protein